MSDYSENVLTETPAIGFLDTLLSQAVDAAIEKLAKDHSSLSIVNANREIYHLLKDSVPVKVKGEHDLTPPKLVSGEVDMEDMKIETKE